MLILLACACLVGLMLAVLGGWFLVPALSGLPWRPSDVTRIRRALDLANLQPGETIFDLGSGDGRIVLLAASEYSAHGVGVELSPIPFLWSWIRARSDSAGRLVELRWGDCFQADLSTADVVVAYMTSAQAARLRTCVERTARPGTRVVSLAFEIPGWQPAVFDPESLVYLYRLPAEPGDLGTYLARSGLPGASPSAA